MARPSGTRLDLDVAMVWAGRRNNSPRTTRDGSFTEDWSLHDLAQLLIERAALHGVAVGKGCTLTYGNVRQWSRRGVLEHTAETIAVLLGTVPEAIWGEEYSALALLDLDDEGDLDDDR